MLPAMTHDHRWRLRSQLPDNLVIPVPIDPTGAAGPTKGQARGSRWRRTSPGLYVPAGTPVSVEQRIVEASRRASGGVVSGWAALRFAGANLFDGVGSDGVTELPIPVLASPTRSVRPWPGILCHRTDIRADETRTRAGVVIADPLRATLDAMCWASSMREAVVVADMSVAASMVTLPGLWEYVRSSSGRHGIDQARIALFYAIERSRTPAETLMRLIWEIDARLPRPLCNWPVGDRSGRRIGRPDILCESLAVAGEFDGRDHRERAVHAADVEKEAAYRNAGLELFRLVGHDLTDTRLAVTRMQDAVRRAAEADRPRLWLRRTDPGPL